MTTDWVDVHIKCEVDAGELLARLEDAAVQGAWQDAETIHLYWPAEEWSPDRYDKIKEALRTFEGSGKPEPDIVVYHVPHEDWNRLWAQSVKALRIGTRIIVRPSWEAVQVRPDQIEIVLDPKQAFGTGHHATTRLLLEWLEDSVQGGESVLDVGTGSGLLAMTALRLGSARAMGIDNDPVAIECAIDYAGVNGFGKELQFRCGTVSQGEQYDLVLANLDRQTLLLLADHLASVTRHRLLVSGVLLDQRLEIAAAFAEAGLYPVAEREAEGWVAIEFGPAQPCEGT